MLMLIMVLDDVSRLDDILQAWTKAGVGGVTILETTGVNRVLQRRHPDAAFAGFSQIFGGGRVGHNTLFAVIDGPATAEAVAAATERIVGDLSQPDTGILFTVPVVQAWGAGQPDPGDTKS